MARDPLERLEIVVDLIDRFSSEIGDIIAELESLQGAIESVDGRTVTIDVDLKDDEQALAALAALRGVEGGDMSVGAPRGAAGGVLDIEGLTEAVESIGDLNVQSQSATRSMRNVSTAADEASDSFSITNLRMTDLHNALAKAVPLILVIIGAMPALIAGMVAVASAAFAAAAALGAIGAFGALGMALQRDQDFLEAMKEVFGDIQDAFIDAFGPLARRLAPMFEDFSEGIRMLFGAIADQGDILLGLRDEARAFGRFMADFVPSAIANMGRMAEAFSGVFGMIANALRDANILRGLTDFMEKALPALAHFIEVIVSLTKHVVDMSIGFLQMTNVILTAVDVFFELINALGISDKLFGFLVGGVLTLVTAFFILNAIISLNLISSLASLGQAFVAAAFEMVAFGSSASVISGIINMLTAETLAWAAATAIATAGLSVVIGMATMAASQWLTTGDSIRSATEELQKFNRIGRRMGGDNPFAEPALSGTITGGGSGNVNVTIQGNADEKTVRETAWNTMIRGRNK